MKTKLFLLMAFLLFVCVSCGDDPASEEESSDTSAEQGDQTDTADDTDTADSAEPSEPTDNTGEEEQTEPTETPDADEDPEEPTPDEEPAEKFCQYACTTASDCIQAGANAISDEDNYKCEGHKCVYLGCLSDAECDEIYAAVTAATGKVYRCNENGAYGYPECTPECTSASECAAGETTDNAFDLDNYKCENSRCVYAGCNSDSECQNGGLENMRCVPEQYGDKILKICAQGCDTPADCANVVYPEEVYLCEDHQCKMKSCESDEWCAENINPKFSCL